MTVASSLGPSAPMNLPTKALVSDFVQANMSLSRDPGTLRGMHFQRRPPHRRPSLLRCVAGALYDVIVDNPVRQSHLPAELTAAELTAENGLALYCAKKVFAAWASQTLASDTMASYMVAEYYTPESEGGYRHDDPGARDLLGPGRVTVDLEQGTRIGLFDRRRDAQHDYRRRGAGTARVQRTPDPRGP